MAMLAGRGPHRRWQRIISAFRADTGTERLEGELLWALAAREHLADLYEQCATRAHAHRRLVWWYGFVAEHPGLELVTLAGTIFSWEDPLLAYFDTRATHGRTEGVNRIIKHVKRTSFGYRKLRQLPARDPLPMHPNTIPHRAS